MKIFAAAALAAALVTAGAANADVIFFEGFSGYDTGSVAYNATTAGVSSTTGDSFTTSYGFRSGATNTGTNSMYDEGTWTIGTNPIDVHSLWIDKPSSDPFLMLNGKTGIDPANPPTSYESNGILVGAGEYQYSYDLLNLCCNANGPAGTPSLLQLWYTAPDSTQQLLIGTVQTTTSAANGWETISGTFNVAQPGGTIHVGLVDNSGIASGNDFGVDNITLASVPEPTSWALMILGFGGAGAALRSRRRLAVAA